MKSSNCFKIKFDEYGWYGVDFTRLRKIFEAQKAIAKNNQDLDRASMLDVLDQALTAYENSKSDVLVFLTGKELVAYNGFVRTRFDENGLQAKVFEGSTHITHLGFGHAVYQRNESEIQGYFESAWEIVRNADDDQLNEIYDKVSRREMLSDDSLEMRNNFVKTLKSSNKKRRNRQLSKFYNEIMGF